MNHFRLSIHVALCIVCMAALVGCATEGPAGSGDSVRAALAAQIVPPQARRASGVDGVAAVETYKNYVESFDSPRPQVSDSAFRR